MRWRRRLRFYAIGFAAYTAAYAVTDSGLVAFWAAVVTWLIIRRDHRAS